VSVDMIDLKVKRLHESDTVTGYVGGTSMSYGIRTVYHTLENISIETPRSRYCKRRSEAGIWEITDFDIEIGHFVVTHADLRLSKRKYRNIVADFF